MKSGDVGSFWAAIVGASFFPHAKAMDKIGSNKRAFNVEVLIEAKMHKFFVFG